MTLLNAIEKVLGSAQQPLHVNEIYKTIIEQDLWQSSGKTPVKTISARLYSDIKKRGDASLFVMVKPQTFMMRVLVENEPVVQTTQSGTKNSEDQIPESETPDKIPSKSNPPIDSMSFSDCAQKVLEEFGGKKPMHYKNITSQARENGWLDTKGKTPYATMNAVVISEIKRQQNRGQTPRFIQHGRGYIGLSQWAARGLTFQIQQQNDKVRQALHKLLLAMSPEEFEKLISRLLPEMGFDGVQVTKYHKDGGIDLRGNLVVDDVVQIKMAVQVKRWKHNVQSPVVQQVRGSLNTHEQGLIITTSDFGKGARKEAAQSDKTPIALMNGNQLVQLLMEHRIGVHRSKPSLFEINKESLTLSKDEEE